MIINGQSLLNLAPIKNMASSKLSAHGTSFGLGEAGYDIRIKQQIQFRENHERRVIFSDIYDEVGNQIVENTISYGRFSLASSMEEFDMPPWLTGVVHDKSTWARRGLSVFNTVIEPGWRGFLTLELVFHGDGELVIPAGAGIAQVLFHENTDQAHYNGKYQNQPDKPIRAIDS